MITRYWGVDFCDKVGDHYEPDEKQDEGEAGVSHDAKSPKDGTETRRSLRRLTLTLTSHSPRFGELFLGAEK